MIFFLLIFKDFFKKNYVCECVSACMHMYRVHAVAMEARRGCQVSLELESQMVVSHPKGAGNQSTMCS